MLVQIVCAGTQRLGTPDEDINNMISRITKVLTASILTICLVGCTSDVKGKKELSVTDELTQNVENIASSITESEIDSGIGSDTGTDTDRDRISDDGDKTSDRSEESDHIGSGIMRDSTYTVRFDIDKGEYCPAETLTTRALTAVRTDEGTLVTWRSFGFNGKMYYQLEKNGKLIYEGELTSFLDHDVFDENAVYTLKYPVNEITNEGSFLNTAERTGADYIETERQRADADNAAGKEQAGWTSGNIAAETAKVQPVPYYEFELQVPPDTKLPNNHFSKHTANDMSVGDLDGDGELELVVKWYPEDAQDNSKDGWTGTTILDGYKLDYNTCTATLMWRIDLGINIRSGAHYTQFQVWDYDGDGCAEIICQTADGTTTYNGKLEETGHVGNASMSTLDSSLTRKKQDYDYRETVNGMGRILSGPEYLTAFSGKTGEIIDTVDYIPARGTEADPKDISSWGDTYGNRSDRFLACTAYIDEGSPAAVFCRGYYARTTIAAW